MIPLWNNTLSHQVVHHLAHKIMTDIFYKLRKMLCDQEKNSEFLKNNQDVTVISSSSSTTATPITTDCEKIEIIL